MRIGLLSIFFLMLMHVGAQDKAIKIIFDAKISQVELMGERLKIAKVKLFQNNQLKDSILTKNGRCFFELDTGKIYKIQFSKTGYAGKLLVIDTHGVPVDYKKKSKVKVDVGLFRNKKMLDVEFLKEKPIGIAAYDYVAKKIQWDREYTKLMVEDLIKATLDYSAKKEKGKRKTL